MSFNKSPLAFEDIRSTFERALASPKGIKIVCSSHGSAVILRSRFNYYRGLDRKENKNIYSPEDPMYNRSMYDRLMLRIPNKGEPDENVLFIEPRSVDNLIIEEIV